MLFAGLKPEEDIPIEFIGLKEGEKITEELWEEWEHPVPTRCKRILVIQQENSLSRGILPRVRRMEEFLARGDREGLLAYIQEIAPEFRGNKREMSLVHVPACATAPAASAIGALNSLGAA